MNAYVRKASQRLLGHTGYHTLQHAKAVVLSKLHPLQPGSRFDEDRLIHSYLKELQPSNRFFVDIGAESGQFGSNTYRLARDGWAGLGIEMNPEQFRALASAWTANTNVSLARAKATPETILPLLHAFSVPSDFAFLSLDIDGYDWYVLERLLTAYRPWLICTEINETIPPPVRFAVDYAPDYCMKQDFFFGQSIAMLHDLAKSTGYALLGLHYNNAFLAPREHSPFRALSAEEAYATGYRDQPERDRLFDYNAWMTHRFEMSPDDLLQDVCSRFAAYEGQFTAFANEATGA